MLLGEQVVARGRGEDLVWLHLESAGSLVLEESSLVPHRRESRGWGACKVALIYGGQL